jgi:serine/threonine protein kinase
MRPHDAVDALLDVIDGLEAAERLGIVHRDIKPSNCFLDRSGRVKIGDFGIARSPKFAPDQTATGIFVGTPAFASPEQLRGQPANNRSDLYSVGATLYALLTGTRHSRRPSAEMLANVMTQPPVPFSEHGVQSAARLATRGHMRLLAEGSIEAASQLRRAASL